MTRPAALFWAAVVALLLAVAGCGGTAGDADDGPSTSPPTGSASPETVGTEAPDDLAEAVSETREDSVYPEVGDPLVDALDYDLALAWTPETDTLTATERLTFRATADAGQVQLDFDNVLAIDSLTIPMPPRTYPQERYAPSISPM